EPRGRDRFTAHLARPVRAVGDFAQGEVNLLEEILFALSDLLEVGLIDFEGGYVYRVAARKVELLLRRVAEVLEMAENLQLLVFENLLESLQLFLLHATS